MEVRTNSLRDSRKHGRWVGPLIALSTKTQRGSTAQDIRARAAPPLGYVVPRETSTEARPGHGSRQLSSERVEYQCCRIVYGAMERTTTM